jgi:hypothetical protein
MRHALIAAAACAALLAAAPATAEIWTRKYEVTGRPAVRIVTDDARVRVHTRDGGPVEFRVEYDVHKVGYVSRRPREPRIVFERNGNTISLEVHEPRIVVVFASVSIRYTIDVTVPRESDVSIRTEDGSIDCEPLAGQTTLETGDGTIRANGLEGRTWLRTGDGVVEAFAVAGQLTARTGDGRVRVDGRFDRLDVSTEDGRVDAVARPGSRLAEAWSLETREGPLTLRIPRDLAAFLDARTGDGRLRVDLPISLSGDLSRRTLAGALNGGGPPLRLRTTDGALTIALAE